ncbi:MAG: hypothetical protein KatS3mg110_1238 [Pirellulaceae bacterium]|nr:MAG: hypothetical protein KatS3mg110_1238 [Pirellulaceae bacterium]
MVRAFAALSAPVILVAVIGCGGEPGANNPAGPPQPAVPAVNNTPPLAEDSFRLTIEDTRPNESTKKRRFLLTVPSSAKVITVFQGEGRGAAWQLSIDPSTDNERQCTFEISRSISEQKEPDGRTVTVLIKLSTPKSSSESPISFPAENMTLVDDVVTFAAEPGLYNLDTPVLLGHLIFGDSNKQPLTLYVKTGDTDPKPN